MASSHIPKTVGLIGDHLSTLKRTVTPVCGTGSNEHINHEWVILGDPQDTAERM
ncbi:hypothetical protein JOB18_047208 [Solea senegalensis]|uniref:Uncharacterized protein n=1 Tax=Solea senegalensis TaxID=28829 RepID=A0AAV6PY45_SOLSE|nr:hypothetical protein JOB18_047208 [Solea senegalensis]